MDLTSPIDTVKGVGIKTAEQLSQAGVDTVNDLIYFLPRAYEDYSNIVKIADMKPGKVTIRAKCEKVSTRFVRRGMRVTTAVLYDDTSKVQTVWFNQSYRETQLKPARPVAMAEQSSDRQGQTAGLAENSIFRVFLSFRITGIN